MESILKLTQHRDIFKHTQMHFHLRVCASVPDFSDDSGFTPLFMTS